MDLIFEKPDIEPRTPYSQLFVLPHPISSLTTPHFDFWLSKFEDYQVPVVVQSYKN
jgi:hypothetical protein